MREINTTQNGFKKKNVSNVILEETKINFYNPSAENHDDLIYDMEKPEED